MVKVFRHVCALLLVVGFSFVLSHNASAQEAIRGQAIGIRIIPNPARLSPLDWYRINVPNPGNAQPAEVDGYPAVRDGRSVYIAGTNYDANSKTLYSNIYLISYSETGSENALAVFDEFLRSFHLNTNIPDAQIKGQLRRDMYRANDLNSIQRVLADFRAKTGKYPVFEAGSYLPNTTYSAWPSWQATFGNVLGVAIPVDPRNEFIGCKAPFDSRTCWSTETNEFSCPGEAYVYGYKVAQDGLTYRLFTSFEYGGPGNWRSTEFNQQSDDQCFNFSAIDAADTDSDGVPGVSDNCNAISNSGQQDSDGDGVGNACDSCPNDPTNDQDSDGVCGNIDNCPTISNADQTDLDTDSVGDVCDFQTCGNNITEGTETCDGQSDVNNFQECSVDCRAVRTQTYCGDKAIQTPNEQGIVEECDGTDETQLCPNFINGYRAQRVRACRNTCRFAPWSECQPIEKCGDAIINGLETCDQAVQNGVQCTAGYAQSCTYCSRVCKLQQALGPRCGDGILQSEQGEECDDANKNGQRCVPAYGKSCNFCNSLCKVDVARGPFCGDGARNIPFEDCDKQSQDTACEQEPTYFYKKRHCVQTATPQNPICTWGPYEACRQVGSCGDGIVNGPEQCDDAKSPGICSQCRRANNSVAVSYTIKSAGTTHTVCLGPKNDWGGDGISCGENATSTTIIKHTDSNGNVGEWWERRFTLPLPMEISNYTWHNSGCGPKHRALYNGGREVWWYEHWFEVGRHCEGSDNMVIDYTAGGWGATPLSGILADVIAGTPDSGGFVRGRISLSGGQTINTENGVVVLEELVKRRWQNGAALPADTYQVSAVGSKFMVWFGSSTKTDSSAGSSSTTNVSTYLLGCVNVNSNSTCDFLE